MAEKGTRVKDGISGDIIATRDANERDEANLDRVVEIVDFGQRFAGMAQIRGYDRAGGTWITSADNFVLTDISGSGWQEKEFHRNRIYTGDKSTLIVQPMHYIQNSYVDITPIGYTQAISRISADTDDLGTNMRDAVDSASWGAAVDANSYMFGHDPSGPYDYQLGIRFTDLAIPQGATILEARILLKPHTTDGHGGVCDITFEDADDPAFPSAATELALTGGGRTYLSPLQWKFDNTGNVAGDNNPNLISTCDVRSQIQSIVDRSGWASGNALFAVIREAANSALAHGYGTAYSSDGHTDWQPSLYVTYVEGGGASANRIVLFETKRSENVYVTGPFQESFDGGTKWLSPRLVWDTLGVESLSLHVTGVGVGNQICLHGGMI